MRRVLRFLAVLAATLVIVLVLALVVGRVYFTGERILSLLRPRLEQHLNRSIEIKDAQLSFWKGLGVRLEGVTVGNALDFGRPYLVHLDLLDIKARFWPLLRGRVVLDRVLVGPGELRLEIDELGRNNWTGIVKGDTAAAPVTPVDSALAAFPKIPIAGKMEFTEVTVSLDDHQRMRMFELTGISGRSEVVLHTADSTVTAAGTFRVAGGEVLGKARSWKLARINPELDFDLWFSTPRRRLELRNVAIRAFGTTVEITGAVERLGDTPAYALNVRMQPVSLADVVAQLPDSLWRPYFPGGPPEGSVQAQFTAHNPPSGERFPALDGKVIVTDIRGRLGEKSIPVAASALNIRLARTVISLSTQSLTVADLPLTASLTIDQLQAPNFSAGLSGDFDVAPVAGVLYPDKSIDAGGRVKFAISGFGAVRNWRNMNLSGRADLAGLRWHTPDTMAIAIDDVTGTIKFNGTGAEIEKLTLRSGASLIDFRGKIDRLAPYLARFGKSEEKPHLQFAVESPFADLDRLIPEDTSTAAMPPLPIIDLVADGTIKLDSAVYFKVPVSGFTCLAHFADLKLTLSEVKGRVYGGTAGGTVTVDFTEWSRPSFVIDAKGEGIEANDFIEHFTNFGGHLFGKLNLIGTFSGQGEEVPDILKSLTAKGGVAMAEGRFEKLDLLSALSAQAGIGGINPPAADGPIKDMAADFWIEGGRLFCRDWSMVSSGTRYNLAGSVGFDGSLDYRIRVELPKGSGGNNVLSALGQMFASGSGGIALNLALTGTYQQPVVKLDSRENQQLFEQNLKVKAQGLLEGLRKK